MNDSKKNAPRVISRWKSSGALGGTSKDTYKEIIDDKNLKPALEILVNGGRYDEGFLSGGYMLFDNKDKYIKGKEYLAFLDLKLEGLIEYKTTLNQGHVVFRGRVDSYKISEKGIEKYEKLKTDSL